MEIDCPRCLLEAMPCPKSHIFLNWGVDNSPGSLMILPVSSFFLFSV
uniref:Uncharacterized protein n=1 Tax=Arundo donax TaxID=35708 RepID=A0A0A9CFM1_ARUDO